MRKHIDDIPRDDLIQAMDCYVSAISHLSAFGETSVARLREADAKVKHAQSQVDDMAGVLFDVSVLLEKVLLNHRNYLQPDVDYTQKHFISREIELFDCPDFLDLQKDLERVLGFLENRDEG